VIGRARAAALVLLLPVATACAHVAPPRPRFVTVFEQRSSYCTIHVVQDTRTQACYITFQCRRQAVQALVVDPTVCVP
jgi:hypothetical protein